VAGAASPAWRPDAADAVADATECDRAALIGRSISAWKEVGCHAFPAIVDRCAFGFRRRGSGPNLNVEPSCREAASGSIGIKQDMSVCLDDEKSARAQIVKEWDQFAATDRTSCTRLSTTGGSPTYTELLVCLEMARDARKLPKEETMGTPR
jgi:hypothetical protein